VAKYVPLALECSWARNARWRHARGDLALENQHRQTEGPRRHGAVLLLLLVCSDIQQRAMMSYQSHMLEHMLVTLVIAPIFAASLSLKHSKPMVSIYFLSFTVLVPLFHLSRLGGIVMLHSGGHDLELLCFLVVGVLFWSPVYGALTPLTEFQKISYVLLAAPVVTFTGLALASSNSSMLATTDMSMTMITLNDVHAGSLVMTYGGVAMFLQGLLLAGRSLVKNVRDDRHPGSIDLN
jgi:cytochrome c oxidase assembly factor CtaG